jgi:predicted Zn-dependent protease
MTDEIEVYTFTMAKIYTDQGHLSKAEAIYRHLLEKDPNNQILIEALASVAHKRTTGASHKDKGLTPLFKEWLALAQRYNEIQKLKKGTDSSD